MEILHDKGTVKQAPAKLIDHKRYRNKDTNTFFKRKIKNELNLTMITYIKYLIRYWDEAVYYGSYLIKLKVSMKRINEFLWYRQRKLNFIMFNLNVQVLFTFMIHVKCVSWQADISMISNEILGNHIIITPYSSDKKSFWVTISK